MQVMILPCEILVLCMLIYFCENRSRVGIRSVAVLYSGGIGSQNSLSCDAVAPIRISSVPLQGWSCVSTQERGALITFISLPRRFMRTGFDPRSGTRGEIFGFY
jgi:hypothetical protein